MRISRTILFRHLLVWAIYITYELALIDISAGLTAPALQYITFYICNVLLFYFNAHIVLDHAFFNTKRPYLTAFLLIGLEIIAYLGLKLLLDGLFKGNWSAELELSATNRRIWLSNVFREIYLIGFSIAYWAMLYMVRFRVKNHAMEKAYLRKMADTLELENKYITAENAFLQNQISPHLLFNTLNFIYNAVHKVSDRAGKGVMLLSEIMRYALLNSAGQRSVALEDELIQVEKLIDLTRLRFGEELHFTVSREGDLTHITILPLILVTLAENMIKHGDLGKADRPSIFRVKAEQGLLTVSTWNKIRESTPYGRTGIGLSNVRKRLNNHYADGFTFVTGGNEEEFTVLLELML